MAGLAHLGFGFAAKRFAPKVPLWVLLVASEICEILYLGFWFAGAEQVSAQSGLAPFTWIHHGGLMSVVWSLASGVIMFLATKNIRSSIVIALVVESHWLLDFVTHPMRAVNPADTQLPLLFGNAPTGGLGLWSNPVVTWVGEFLILGAGVGIYIFALRKILREKKLEGGQYGQAM